MSNEYFEGPTEPIDLGRDRKHPSRVLEKGDRIGRYEIDSELGRGGQAVVYRAVDTELRRPVALKVLHGQTSDRLLKRFRREAEITSRLDHPNICQIYEIGGVEFPFIAMQLVDGVTMARKISEARTPGSADTLASGLAGKSGFIDLEVSGHDPETHAGPGPLPSTRSVTSSPSKENLVATLRVFETLAGALHAAHERGVVHRDVKPGNIMIDRHARPIILDFGLAHDAIDDDASLTQTGEILGTPAYMSPEQITGGRVPVDARTDVFALGVTLFECVTLQRAFHRATRESTYRAIISELPENPRKHNRNVSKDLATVIETAMAKDPSRRYETAGALAEDLRRVCNREPILARPPGPVRRVADWSRRHPGPAVGLIAVFTLLVITATFFAIRSRDQARALARAQRLADLGQLETAKAEAALLVPPGPELVPALENWLEQHAALAERRSSYELQLRQTEAQALPIEDQHHLIDHRRILDELAAMRRQRSNTKQTNEDEGTAEVLTREIHSLEAQLKERQSWGFPGSQVEGEDLAFKRAVLQRLVTELHRFDNEQDGLLRTMQERLRQSKRMVPETIEKHREAWQAVIQRLSERADLSAAIREPIPGLIPLGQDPTSGFEEFLHWLSHEGPLPVRGENGELDVNEQSGIILVLIPGGETLLGAQDSDPQAPAYDQFANAQETPCQKTRLDPYLVSKFETTQDQWWHLFGEDPSAISARKYDPDLWEFQPLNGMHPVESVSWEEASSAAVIAGLDLPTEAQWEHACRGGTGWIWYFRDSKLIPEHENLFDQSLGRAFGNEDRGHPWNDRYAFHAPVGSYKPNPFGLHDFLGNVEEWCLEPVDRARTGPMIEGKGRRIPTDGDEERRVVRGGHFRAGAVAEARCARRGYQHPSRYDDGTIGVRFVLNISP